MDAEALANAVFVDSRGRPPALAQRFPGLFGGEGEAITLERDGRLVAALVMRPLVWLDMTVIAIGLVAVEEEVRSRGLGHELLRAALSRVRERGIKSCVLWARRHELYVEAGFSLHDVGVLGEAAGLPGAPGVAVVAPAPVQLAPLRDPGAPARPAARWHTIPLPATEVRAAVTNDGYAVFGVHGDDRFVYELAGDPASFDALWQAVRAGARHVTINERHGSPAQIWLAAQGVRFKPQALALWRGPTPARYVPWLDRI
jgi:GNAT superfamily N-acetyltransferase